MINSVKQGNHQGLTQMLQIFFYSFSSIIKISTDVLKYIKYFIIIIIISLG